MNATTTTMHVNQAATIRKSTAEERSSTAEPPRKRSRGEQQSVIHIDLTAKQEKASAVVDLSRSPRRYSVPLCQNEKLDYLCVDTGVSGTVPVQEQQEQHAFYYLSSGDVFCPKCTKQFFPALLKEHWSLPSYSINEWGLHQGNTYNPFFYLSVFIRQLGDPSDLSPGPHHEAIFDWVGNYGLDTRRILTLMAGTRNPDSQVFRLPSATRIGSSFFFNCIWTFLHKPASKEWRSEALQIHWNAQNACGCFAHIDHLVCHRCREICGFHIPTGDEMLSHCCAEKGSIVLYYKDVKKYSLRGC